MERLATYFTNLPQLAITWGIFFGAGVIFFAVQIVRNRKRFSLRDLFNTCIPFDPIHSKSFHMDVTIYLIRKFIDSLCLIPGTAILSFISFYTFTFLVFISGHEPSPVSGLFWTFLCTILMFINIEFSDFIIHYMEHKIPVLWELHKVHHSADFLNPLTSKRGHSLAITYDAMFAGVFKGIPAGAIMFVFNLSLPELVILSEVASKIFAIWTLDPLKHSHLPVGLGWLESVLISPHMHQVHHSKIKAHWDKNFGTNLSIFDWLFKTAYRPAKDETLALGISGYSEKSLQKFNTFKGAFVDPITNGLSILRGRYIGADYGRPLNPDAL